MTIQTLAFLGDSLEAGLVGSFSTFQGGQGSHFEQTMERLANTLGVARLSSGFRCSMLGTTEAVFTTGANAWTDVTSSQAWDKLPYGLGRYGTGINKTLTFTCTTAGTSIGTRPVVGFALYWVDLSNGSTIVGGNWQYRIDGGTWTNMGQTLAGNNAIKKFYVATAVTSTVDVRCYNGSADCYAMVAGIEWFWTSPVGATSGIIGHNYAMAGHDLHETAPASSPGDHLAILDSVSLGSGSPPSSTPNSGTIYFGGHDAIDFPAGSASFADDFETLYTRAKPLGVVGVVNPYEFSVALAAATVQTSFRDAITQRVDTLTTSNPSNPPKLLDLFNAYVNLGFVGANAQGAALFTAGYTTDGTHPSQFGHNDLTPRIYWWIRQQFLALGNVPSTYTATAKQAAVQYAGKQAAVYYMAATPVSVA